MEGVKQIWWGSYHTLIVPSQQLFWLFPENTLFWKSVYCYNLFAVIKFIAIWYGINWNISKTIGANGLLRSIKISSISEGKTAKMGQLWRSTDGYIWEVELWFQLPALTTLLKFCLNEFQPSNFGHLCGDDQFPPSNFRKENATLSRFRLVFWPTSANKMCL